MNPRPIKDVMQAVLNVLPPSPKKDALKSAYDNISKACDYTAPEFMPYRWNQLCEETGALIGTDNALVRKIINAEYDYKLYLPEYYKGKF